MNKGSISRATRRRAWLAVLLVLAAGSVLTGSSLGSSDGGALASQRAAGGTVVAWGCGTDKGPCNVPNGLSGVTAIAAGGHSLALKTDGTVVAWGCDGADVGQCSVPGGLSGVMAIAAGNFQSLALTRDGRVVAWGCGDDGQCSVPSGLSGVTAIAAGAFQSLALKRDGTVVAWGSGASSNHSVPTVLAGVTAISAGTWHSLALRRDGTVVAWGFGCDVGQCDVPSGLSGVSAVAAGSFQSLALKRNGTVVAWGCKGQGPGTDADFGQCDVPSDLSGVVAVAAGFHHSLALKTDGTVVAWGCGGDLDGECSVPSGLSGVTAIAAASHSLALVEQPNQPPDCSHVAASPGTLAFQGPDRLTPVALSGATDPEGGPLAYRVVRVTQDEPVVGLADRSWPDSAYLPGWPAGRLLVRAEANPRLNGRVYRIAYGVSDRDGGTCSGVAKVSVLRKQGTPAVDDGDAASWDSLTGLPVR